MIFLNYSEIAGIISLGKTEADYPGLVSLEKSALAGIEEYLFRGLENQNEVEVFDRNLSDFGFHRYPIVTINSVTRNSVLLVEDSDYIVTQWGIKLLYPDGLYDVTVDYDGGYSTLPPGLYRALLAQTIYEWQNRDHMGSTSVTTDGGSIQRPELGLLKEVKRICNKYRHPLKGIW